MQSYDTINRTLTREYAPVQQALIDEGLFEEIEIDTEKLATSFSRIQEILAVKGVSQQSIDKLIEALWLVVHLGIRERTAKLHAALAEIERVL